MALELLPDWRDPIVGGGAGILRPWTAGGAFAALPSALELDHSRGPGFRLELVRSSNPDLPPEPYGVIELSLRAHYDLDGSLALARAVAADARVERAPIADGWLRLVPMGEDDAPTDLRVPTRLSTNGLEGLTWVLKVSSSTASLLRGVLTEEGLALEARADVEIEAVAPRIDARVSFTPAALLSAVAAAAGATVARPDLVAFLTDSLTTLPVEIHGAERDVSADRMAERLADLIRARYARPVPPPDGATGVHLALAEDAAPDAAEVDLSLPESVHRPFELAFDPLAAVRAEGGEGSAFAVIETEVPSFPTGVHEVEVYANLPRDRRGVLAVGADLVAPPRPPERVHPAVATVEIPPDRSTASATMRLAPGEELAITATPFAIVRDATGIERLEGESSILRTRTLELSADSWPLSFVRLGAGAELLSHGALRFGVSYTFEGAPVTSEFVPDAAATSASLAIPSAATDVTVSATLTSSTGESVTVGPRAASELRLDLSSFGGYGPQVVPVSCELPEGVDSYAVDLVPAGAEDAPGAVTVLLLTRTEPQKQWRFFSSTPFAATFRHRPHAAPGAPEAAWSDPVPAGPLQLTVAVPA